MEVAEGPFIVKVRIVSQPDGEAPQWVRNAWISVEFNVIGGIDEDLVPRGVLSKKLTPGGKRTLSIPEHQALNALRIKSPDAYKWWVQNGFPEEGKIFVFNVRECKEISERRPLPTPVWDLQDGHGAHDNPDATYDPWEDLN